MSGISFANQVAVITGAGRALGREYALDIASRGGSVVVADIGGFGEKTTWAEKVVAEIGDKGGVAIACHENVATPDGGRALVDLAIAHFGRLDVIIHNAGFLRPAFFEEMTLTMIDEVMQVHLLAAFYVAQPAWRIMQKQGYGRVVLTSSAAVFGNEAGANYAAAKAGLLGLARALAQEGRLHGICVNCVLPFAKSNIALDNPIPGEDSQRNRTSLDAMAMRREPRSVSPLVVYLSSSACSTNGQAFSALAGRYARIDWLVGKGWIAESDSISPEEIHEKFQRIENLQGGFTPGSMNDEISAVFADLKAENLI